MIHVCHVIPALPFGGAERMLVDLINYCDPKQFKFSVIVFGEYNPLASQIKNAEIFVVPKKGKISLGLIGDLQKKLAELKPDIVHTHLFGGDLWGRLAAKRLGLPVITTEHNTNDSEGVVKNWLRKFLRDKSDFYVACSEHVKKYMAARYGIAKNVAVIRNGIDLAKFLAVPPAVFGAPARCLILGRLTKQKGHEFALAALASLKNCECRLSIVGSGELSELLKKKAGILGIEEHVNFEPATGDVPRVLAVHDILLMPSLWEGLGVVAMEAMTAGRLVVASRVGGIPELVKDGETGFLVSPADAEALAKKLKWCFEHPTQCAEIAEKARAYALANFGVEKMVNDYQKIYTKILCPADNQ